MSRQGHAAPHAHPPTRPMCAASATPDDVEFTFDTAADGEPQVSMIVHLSVPAARTTWQRGLAAPRAIDRAWAQNATCLECGKRVHSPRAAGLVELADGHRVAHRPKCWLLAVSRLNPLFQKRVSLARAEGRKP